MLALAVVRPLEIIGEAATRVPVEERARRSEIPWSSIVGLRNRLIHGYDDVDHDIIWAIVSTDLAALVSRLSNQPSQFAIHATADPMLPLGEL